VIRSLALSFNSFLADADTKESASTGCHLSRAKESNGVKTPLVLALWLALLGIVGCRHPDPPPPSGGVNVQFPGGSVNVNDRGTNVIAPGTQVRTP
jgi:hypothetical protein